MLQVREIVELMEEFAPTSLAADWDNVGLQVGNMEDQISAVLVTLDVTERVIREAIEKKAGLIISHHPVTRGKIDKLDLNDFVGSRLWTAANAKINIFVAHTNLDACSGGVSDILADKLGLRDTEVLVGSAQKGKYKLVCFVPPSHVGSVADAIIQAGGGAIGEYTHCTFRTSGKGTFRPGPDSKPFVATEKEVTEVDEVRLEVRVSRDVLGAAISEMIKAHPYEEVAYDVYGLAEPYADTGFGRIGDLDYPIALGECAKIWRRELALGSLKMCGDPSKKIKRVAVCGGSGGDLISVAKSKGADAFITGDVKYHDAQLAEFLDLAIIDAGHYHTEKQVVDKVTSVLKAGLADERRVKIFVSESNTNPWFQD
jgi:dinuclear metal center YbgI/SA1388 family protein